MTQPLMDTRQVADELEEKAELERTQAQGVARTLNTALTRSVAPRSEVEAGFEAIRSEIETLRVELKSETKALRDGIDALAGQIRFGATVFGVTTAATLALIAMLHAGEPAAPAQAATPPVVVYAVPWPNGGAPVAPGLPAPVPPPATEASPQRP